MNRLNSEDFSIKNKDDKAVIYITADPTYNLLTFKIIAKNVDKIDLKGGPPVAGPDKAGGSSFNFNFETILSPEVVQGLDIVLPDGWQKAFFKGGDKTLPGWSVSPKDNVVIGAGQCVVFTIKNLTCQTTQAGNFEIKYFNLNNFPDSLLPVTIHLDVLTPFDPGKKTLALDDGYIDVIHPIGGQSLLQTGEGEKITKTGTAQVPIPIVITYNAFYPIENGFTLYLKNTSKDPIVQPKGGLGGDQPVFYISFLFGGDDDCLTTQQLADQNKKYMFSVQAEKSSWLPIDHTDGTAYWAFLPQSPEILFGYETVKFIVRKIITPSTFNPSTITTLYIQFNNIPGYNDGCYTVDLVKQTAKATVDTYTGSPLSVAFGKPVYLTWTTSLAWRVTLSYFDRDNVLHMLDSQKPADNLKLNAVNFPLYPSKHSTDFKLQVYDYSPDPADEKSVPVTVDEPSAQIASFTANPPLVDISKSDAYSQLQWQTSDAKNISLEYAGQTIDVSKLTGYKVTSIDKTTPITLEAKSYEGAPILSVKSTLTVYAYKSKRPVSVGPKGDGGSAPQSLPLVLPNPAKPVIYVGNSTSNQVYEVDVNAGVTVKQYDGHIIALSPDGRKLFVANAKSGAPSTITMIDTGSHAAFSIDLDGPPPYTMIVKRDGSRLFAAAQHWCTTVTVYNIDNDNNRLSKIIDIPVGTSPRAFAFNPDETRLYVANYDSANPTSISVINLADYSVAPIPMNPTDTEPFALAFVSQKNKLYVACEGQNFVAVIDAAANKYLKDIAVGDRPFALALKPNEGKLYVANFNTATVSVIDTATDTVIKTLSVGQGPCALLFNRYGTLLFVANYCSKTVSLVDTAGDNDTVIAAIDVGQAGGNPLGLGVYFESLEITDLYVAKEYFKPRIGCVQEIPGPDLDVSIYAFFERPATQKPGH